MVWAFVGKELSLEKVRAGVHKWVVAMFGSARLWFGSALLY